MASRIKLLEKKKRLTGVREPLEDLRVRAEAKRVETIVAGERPVEVGRGGVAYCFFVGS